MDDQPMMFTTPELPTYGWRPNPDSPRTRARTSDPQTSHDAARSVDLSESQAAVFAVIAGSAGGVTDQGVERVLGGVWSPSRCRTARVELVRLGRVVDGGGRERTRSGRLAVVWEVKS